MGRTRHEAVALLLTGMLLGAAIALMAVSGVMSGGSRTLVLLAAGAVGIVGVIGVGTLSVWSRPRRPHGPPSERRPD